MVFFIDVVVCGVHTRLGDLGGVVAQNGSEELLVLVFLLLSFQAGRKEWLPSSTLLCVKLTRSEDELGAS